MLVAGLVVITLVCGLGGFCWQYENLYEAQVAAAETAAQKGHSEPMPVRDWSIPVYKTIQLFLLNSGAEDDLGHPSSWLLWTARLSTISLLIVLSFAAITNIVDQVRALPRQMTQKGHVVICGLGQIGLKILDDVLKLTPKRQVVVIENNPESPWLEHARLRGVAVVIGDATRADKLREARAEHAAEVFIVTGDDGVNLEVAAELGTLLKPSSKAGRATPSAKPIDPIIKSTQPLNLYVHIADVNFSSTLQPNSHVLHSNDAMRVQVFNVPRAAATRLITEQVVQHAPQSDNEVAHYVIVGFGAMGQTLAVQLAQLAHFGNLKRSRISIADKDVRSTARGFLARFPRFTSWTESDVGVPEFSHEADAWTFNAHPLPEGIHVPHDEAVQYATSAEFVDLPHGTGGELFARHLAERFAATDVTVKPVVFICGQQDRENFESAVRLRRLLENESATAKAGQAVPIFVWLPRQPALAGCLREETGFIPFGECRTSASYREITLPLREKLGQAIHAEHEKHKLAPAPNPHPAPWESTRDDFRESSRAAADHALIKLAAIGKTLQQVRVATKNAAPLVAPNSPEETRLAQMEHNRWLAERLMTDWRYAAIGEDKDVVAAKKEQRLNQTITPWENLSPEERDKDVRQVRTVLRAIAATKSS